jgi:hypothetical protein
MRQVRLALPSLALAALACAQDDLGALKQVFRQPHRAEDLLPRLIAYHDSSGASFEVDYMIAATMADVPRFRVADCSFVGAAQSAYRPPYQFDSRPVSLDDLRRRVCAGVSVIMTRKAGPPPDPLKEVRDALHIRTAPTARVNLGDRVAMKADTVNHGAVAPAVPAETDGRYAMVHDGWKGELFLRANRGRYTSSDGHVHPVQVISPPGYHIVFVVVGLGGENADGLGGQKFDGYLMTQTRDAIAGVTWWQGSAFGFYAVKQ